MKKPTVALVGSIAVVATLAAWLILTSPSYRSARLDEQIAAVEREIAADAAALLRERVECATAAREFGAAMAASCWKAYAVQAELLASSRAAAHRRLAQLEAERAALR